MLKRAITERLDFAFETTLGGNTIPRLLETAYEAGLAVRIWYAGLDGPELHIARVRARVREGGHDIPEPKIRERYERSRTNLIRLLPKLAELRLFDNSEEGNPALGVPPKPRLILHLVEGTIAEICELENVPHWAKPIVIVAIRLPL